MKTLFLTLSLMLLTGCSVTRQAQVSDVDTANGVVRLSYGQAILQNAHTDGYLAQGTANRECQQQGYATAIRFGQPVETCSVFAGSLCLNTNITISYQCQGVAVVQSASYSY
ncbi:hypothetical protein C3432_01300 [Citrobacter amalonaticus]|uniref:Lipoprotein n=1 Tax=Citrobacter amalonaticus TaxID=35703 RepID=A0A2S4S287_CITAM|nr:YecR family lipoprotein [Citrobacter amalonaticus]POT59393.1 hypothetical protein C3432_01300 [Citrobacter amalonaticus]POT77523.1 hypothetical protein C3436_08970 [Citrobacter amalonaticus]POU67975.1 hypothetical protein C3430_02505 [Citrobacter amalonaticus]POV07579.1 hypothetical protein C3424_02515 [Citrobacter amalonaticus]